MSRTGGSACGIPLLPTEGARRVHSFVQILAAIDCGLELCRRNFFLTLLLSWLPWYAASQLSQCPIQESRYVKGAYTNFHRRPSCCSMLLSVRTLQHGNGAGEVLFYFSIQQASPLFIAPHYDDPGSAAGSKVLGFHFGRVPATSPSRASRAAASRVSALSKAIATQMGGAPNSHGDSRKSFPQSRPTMNPLCSSSPLWWNYISAVSVGSYVLESAYFCAFRKQLPEILPFVASNRSVKVQNHDFCSLLLPPTIHVVAHVVRPLDGYFVFL